MEFYFESTPVSESTRQKEKQKAKLLRKSNWWTAKVQREKVCYYCREEISLQTATMDHIVPIARGGKSTKGNLAVCCKECNTQKKYLTPVEWQHFLDQVK